MKTLNKSQRLQTILTLASAVGVIATSITAVKVTPKAIKLLKEEEEQRGEPLTNVDKILTVGSLYIPPIILGVSTIMCILGANALNKKSQATLLAGYELTKNSFKEYRDTLIELKGEEVDREIRDNIMRTHSEIHITDLNQPDQKIKFVESYSGQEFFAYEREVMDAEYHLNRNFCLRGYATINEFAEFLGIKPISSDDRIMWAVGDEFYWIDFEHIVKQDKNGNYVCYIEYIFAPSDDHAEDYYW